MEQVENLTNREAFTMEELPQVVPFSIRSLYRMLSSGEFPKADKKLGRRRMWTRDTIKDWLKSA